MYWIEKIYVNNLNIFAKLFPQKYPYIYFDLAKNQLVKTKLSKNEVEFISKNDFEEDLANLSLFIKNIKIHIAKNEPELSDFDNQFIEIIKNNLQKLESKLFDLNKKDFERFLLELRKIYKSYLATITNDSWQSPDYGYSKSSQHGIFQKKIHAFYNDYQRYKTDTSFLEKDFDKKTSIISNVKKRIYIFNSGMGAFSSLLDIFGDFEIEKKLAGKNLYFELISLLKCKKNIFFIEEDTTKEIIDFIKEQQPKYLFFDPVNNNHKMKVFKFKELFDYYKKNPPTVVTSIIIDTSLCLEFFELSSFFDNDFPEKLNIFLFRSLQKMDQIGLDISQGGLIIHYGQIETNLELYRQMGNNLEEISLLNFEIMANLNLEKKLLRHSRNTLILADFLSSLKNNILEKVIHPSITNNDFEIYYNTPLLFFKLNSIFTLEDNNFFMQKLINEAKVRDFSITVGSSFGFNNTRIMPVSFDDSNEIYFRLSLGMENLDDVLDLTEIFEVVFNSFLVKIKSAYEKAELPLFKAKVDKFNDIKVKINKDLNFDEKDFFQISFLMTEIMKDLSKFENFKETRDFSQKQKEIYITDFLELSVNANDEIKKMIIKYISQFA